MLVVGMQVPAVLFELAPCVVVDACASRIALPSVVSDVHKNKKDFFVYKFLS
jgi:hypothetical protein